MDAQLIVVRKRFKDDYYKNHFSKTQPSKTKSNNFSFTEENVVTNNELDDSNLSETEKKKVENYRKRKKKTVLIVGDSMLNGIEESKLSKTRHIRVQPIPGGKIDDIKENLNDLLHEELQKVISHVGTNNAMTDTPKEIFKKLISLKHQIESILPKCEVTISNLIMKIDEPKAVKINEEVNRLIKSANISFVENGNIKGKQLGKRGLHLNIQGNKMFARNLLNAIRNWYNVGSSDLVFNYVDTDFKNVNIMCSNKNSTHQWENESIDEISNGLNNNISGLINLKKGFSKNSVLSYLNINNLGGKFDNLWEFCFKTEVDILCIDETKIDPSYPDSQFHIDGYQFPPFRKDRNKHGRGNGIIGKGLNILTKVLVKLFA